MNDTVKKEPVKAVSLKSLMTPSKTVDFDYPGCEGMKVSLCYLAREELVKLRNRCVSQKLKSSVRPWKVIPTSRKPEKMAKMKSFIKDKIVNILDNFALENDEIQNLIEVKREFLLENFNNSIIYHINVILKISIWDIN